MPIFLVDSNFLEEPKLESYLSQSTSNKIVIPEQVMVELHKGDPVFAIIKGLENARKYPRQVLVGKTLPACYGRAIKTGQQVRELIDYPQSKHFATWYDDIKNNHESPDLQRHLNERRQDSLGVIQHLADGAHEILPALKIIKDRFDKGELKEVRGGKLVNETTQLKLVQAGLDMMQGLFSALGVAKNNRPTPEQAVHYYLFRYAMCMVALFIKFARAGNLTENTDFLVNTLIDLHIAAEATYFHGILSKDAQVLDAYGKTRQIARAMRGYVPNW
jgi:hypothetical protein